MKESIQRCIPRALSAGLCLLMLITLMMGVSGCMFRSSEEIVAPKMLEYMKEKYGEEFTLSDNNFMQANFAGTPTSLLMYSESHPEWIVTVNYTPGEPFTDNYVAFLKMDEVQEYLAPYFKEIYGEECRVFIREPSNQTLPTDINKDIDIDTYLTKARAGLNVFVNKDMQTREADAEKLWTLDAMRGYSLSVRVYYFSQEAFDSEITQENNAYELLPYLCFADFTLPRNRGEFEPSSWREGEAPEETDNESLNI